MSDQTHATRPTPTAALVNALRLCALAALVFAGVTPAAGYWFTNCSYGWAEDTSLVADINPWTADAVEIPFGRAPRGEYMAVYAGVVFFQADDGVSGPELWRTGGGMAAMAADIVPGAEGSAPHSFAVFQDRLYFAATTPATGEELFSFAGSVALAAETVTGTGGGKIFGLTVHDGALYFARTPPNGGHEVWRFDGALAQPVSAINGAPGHIFATPAGDAFVSLGGRLYFVRDTPLPARYELWAFDGNSATKVLDLTAGYQPAKQDFGLGTHAQTLYFGAVLPDPNAPVGPPTRQLWIYSPQAGAAPIASLGNQGSAPGYFQVFKGKLHFVAVGELFRLDASGPQSLSLGGVNGVPLEPANPSLFSAANRLFLTGQDGWPYDNTEPYLFDGNTAQILENIMPDVVPGPSPDYQGLQSGSHPTFAVEADGLYFFAEDEYHGRELWRSTLYEVPYYDCEIVVALEWENWLRWPLDRREVVVTTWFVDAEETIQLTEEALVLTPTSEARLQVLEIDGQRGVIPTGFALVTRISDRATGEVLDQGVEMVGVPEERAGALIESAVAELLAEGAR